MSQLVGLIIVRFSALLGWIAMNKIPYHDPSAILIGVKCAHAQ